MGARVGVAQETSRDPAVCKPELTVKPAAARGLILLAAGLCAVITLPVAWIARQWISTDGFAYLEVANNAAELSAWYLVSNGCWSPAYPALIAAIIKLANPLPSSQLAVIHALDWAICSSAYGCFGYLLYTLLRWVQYTHAEVFESRLKLRSIVTFAYALLLFSNIQQLSVWSVHGSDLLVEALVYLAAGLCLELSLPSSRRMHYATLGLTLALAYATKAALFPLSIILLIILFMWPVADRGGRKGVLIAAGSFLIASFPLVAALSYSKGRITFGESGRLNYAWYVNDVPYSTLWEDELPHSPVKIAGNPVVLKLNGPARSTWPIWYDPTYWYDGIRAHFDLRQQIGAYLVFLGIRPGKEYNAANIKELSQRWIPLLAGVATFVLMGVRFNKSTHRSIVRHIWLFLWPASAFFMFASVHLEQRYLIPFIVLGWVGLFVACCILMKSEKSTPIILVVTVSLLMTDGWTLLSLRHIPSGVPPVDISGSLERLGIRRGDELATVGAPGIPPAYFPAWLVGARYTYIIVGDPDKLVKLPEGVVRTVIAALRSSGAKAIVSAARPAFEADSGWVEISRGLFLRPLK